MPASHDALRTAASQTEQSRGARLSRLLVGYDSSDSANAAAAFGLWLAGKTGCEATLIHAGPTPEMVPSVDLLPAAAVEVAAYEREWQWRLENLREYATKSALVECLVVRGQPAGALITAAVDTGADMILTGSQSVSCVRGALLGSASSQVGPGACTVLGHGLSRRHASAVATHTDTIVVGIDGSASSRHALEFAEALAVPLGAKLVLVHASDPHVPLAVMTTGGIHDMLRRHGHELLEEAGDAVTAPLGILREVVDGDAPHALVDACTRHAPALLAVGSRGLGGFMELLLGSTSRWVVNRAPCPVLVARGSLLAEERCIPCPFTRRSCCSMRLQARLERAPTAPTRVVDAAGAPAGVMEP